MSFVTLLRNEVKILWSCINFNRTGRIVEVSTRWKPNIVSRTLFNERQNSPPDKIVAFFQRKDKIPSSFHLIYRVPNVFSFTVAHTFTMVIIFCLPVAFFIIAERNNYKYPIKLFENISIRSISELIAVTGCVLSLATLTVVLVKRFPLRIYHNKSTDEYVAVFSDLFRPWTITPMKFKRGEVNVIPESDIYVYQISNYKINGSKVIFIEDHFFRPIDLEYMLSSPNTDKKRRVL